MLSDRLHQQSLVGASTTFGVVTLVLALALLAAADVFGWWPTMPRRRGVTMAVTLPLVVTVLVTLAVRVERFVH